MELLGFRIGIILLRQSSGDGVSDDSKYDFSNYAQLGCGQTLCLDDTIDTMSIQLVGLPFRQEFEPTSLFRVTIYQDFVAKDEYGVERNDTFSKTYDYALQQDDVEQPDMSDDTYFIHNLTLANPAIIAQQRTVDNIAVTYKLQDVYLESNGEFLPDLTKKIGYNFTVVNANTNPYWLPPNDYNFGNYDIDFWTIIYTRAYYFKWTYPNISYPASLSESNPATFTIDNTFSGIRNLNKNYLYGDGTTVTIGGVTYNTTDSVSFNVPLLEMYKYVDGDRAYAFCGYLPVDIIVTKTNNDTLQTTETTYVAYPSKYIQNANGDTEISLWTGESHVDYYDNDISYRGITNFNGLFKGGNVFNEGMCIIAYDKYDDDVIVNNEVKNRTITINLDSTYNCTYDIKFRRHQMPQRIIYLSAGQSLAQSSTPNPIAIYSRTQVWIIEQGEEKMRLDDNLELYMNFSFNSYIVNNINTPLFLQAKQIDAYYLFNKAQLAVTPIKKTSGIPYYNNTTISSANLNTTKQSLPFVVSETDKTLLQRTLLNESDFIGKNLWEVFSEIGKYIHAKPKISVITLDEQNYNSRMTGQFLVSFLKYGSPEINAIQETSDTIFNSRFAQEYINELDNYVENYFNLGSYLTEYLHITSESEDGLIYNDVAKLITRYPILEILSLVAYNSGGTVKDITKYIFEYNIYKTLNYDTNYIPSKHKAIYYHLGENVIQGMQFVVPKSSGVEVAYSMKNILATVFNIATPDNITISDYVFKIKYRAKDNTRVSISRPDLRKYLLNSNLDPFPIHTQFNQQQDKIISSDNFGVNAYGKLIRTGNTTYEYYNWTNDINKVMEAGNLYNLDNQMYYVSKVNRVYYAEHIEERVELTQDFNRLSQIIGIPSQPRFYEISERNIVNRDIKFNDYIVISAQPSASADVSGFLTQTEYYAINGMFNPLALPEYVLTLFKSDSDKEYNTSDIDSVYQTMTPALTYASKNTLTIEWDMVDNYSAGDKSTTTGDTLQWSLNLYSFVNYMFGGTLHQNYLTKDPVRYVDAYGRADLVDFIFFRNNLVHYYNEVYEYPETDLSNFTTRFVNSGYYTAVGSSNDEALKKLLLSLTMSDGIDEFKSNSSGYIIAKDNRERLSFNYNIQYLLGSDRIVLGNKLWIKDLGNPDVKIVLLNTEISKFDSDLINDTQIIAVSNSLAYSNVLKTDYISGVALWQYLDIENNLTDFTEDELNNCKAYAVVRADKVMTNNDTFNATNYRLIIGRNVSDLEEDKIINFYFTKYEQDDVRYTMTNRSQLDDFYNEE